MRRAGLNRQFCQQYGIQHLHGNQHFQHSYTANLREAGQSSAKLSLQSHVLTESTPPQSYYPCTSGVQLLRKVIIKYYIN